jgi:FAD/FMN-containing dehydrogenase
VIGPEAAASFGDLDAGAHRLAVRLGGRTRTVDRMVTEATAVARRQGAREVCELEGHAASSLWRRAADFGWDEAARPTVGVRASATPASVGRLWEAFQHQETAPAGRAALVCHPAHGVVQACWYHGGAQLGVEAVRALIQSVREAVSSEGGNMVVETCPPSAKAGLDVWDDVGDQITVMRALKDQYDPERILSPGRYAGGI